MENIRTINVPFSPPDITDEEIEEVVKAMKSGWITTGPRTKEFERKIAERSQPVYRVVSQNNG